jgi:uncharacterized DUF497 family protein
LNQFVFEWDKLKNQSNIDKHGVSFDFAKEAFFDEHRIIAKDLDHSTETETRWHCIGKIGNGILTVRFTYRNNVIRIFGAGYWRKGKKYYEDEN